MALIIENGAGVIGANSYATVATVQATAAALGLDIEGTEAEIEPFVLKTMNYLESKRAEYQGHKVSATQALQFPRNLVVIDEYDWPNNQIPQNLIQALAYGTYYVSIGEDLQPINDSVGIVKAKVDVLEVEFSESVSDTSPVYTIVDDCLKPLFWPETGYHLTKRIGF